MEKSSARIELVQADITRLWVGAIVNAANRTLLGGGGVDGAIHQAAGPRLLEACRTLGGCATGKAKITKGYRLSARYIIHTVDSIYRGSSEDARLLGDCYHNSLKLALKHRIGSIAFPAISCGIYDYPISEASRITLSTTHEFLAQNPYPYKAIFVLYSQADHQAYHDCLNWKGYLFIVASIENHENV